MVVISGIAPCGRHGSWAALCKSRRTWFRGASDWPLRFLNAENGFRRCRKVAIKLGMIAALVPRKHVGSY